ncbi:MAG: hypothetical protein OES09_10995 [Gammaproteobacteria bacterium]|nr:hypothetical protein [Gammaproteobacteria bacterium]
MIINIFHVHRVCPLELMAILEESVATVGPLTPAEVLARVQAMVEIHRINFKTLSCGCAVPI